MATNSVRSSRSFRESCDPSGTTTRLDRAALRERIGEDLEARAREDRRAVDQLEPEAGVGTIAAVAAHRLGMAQAPEAAAPASGPRPPRRAAATSPSINRKIGGPSEERHLEVDLRELGLAVGAQVLVPEAARDLIVAIDARDHEDLLEELRRLREREERARVDAARHEVVARAFGRAARQHRGLDLDEAVARSGSRASAPPCGGAARGS